ncbi:MAG TPA: S41 family peptidase [Rhabdochlamydiaceae bacterium]|nr:S41 family peptidase [Rhabdochlamydiaceae bacterium]
MINIFFTACRRSVWLFCGLFLLANGVLFSAGSQQLKSTDVRLTMQEMFNYHVEYKEISPLLIRRSLKIFIEQFDADKTYLLASEVKPYLDVNDSQVQSVVQGYYANDFSTFRALNEVIQKASLRARAYRKEIEKELILNPRDDEVPSGESYLNYSPDVDQLKARIRRQVLRALWFEKRVSSVGKWTPEQKEKVFALWEKRFRRLENSYLFINERGQKISSERAEHYLVMHILKAMAKSLDAHTAYFSPEEAAEMRASLEKQFEGVGVVLREGIDGVVIIDLVKGGPAERCGKIAVGDLLVEIDGKSVSGSSYEEILKAMKGQGAKQLELGFKRAQEAGKENVYRVALKRERIVMQEDRVKFSSEPYADGIIGKLILPSFYESGASSSCETDLKEAIRSLKKQGKLYGLVLDMRENSGGFLNQAVKVSGLFISSGVIVISKYSQGEVQYLRDLDVRVYYNGPLIVLPSKASASAAEIVAQALQDYGTGLVAGDERTYGKGTIQYQTVTDDAATSYFKVTVGRYYTVSGRSTQIEGVQADIVVPTIYSAYNIGEKYLEYPLKSDRVPPAYVDPLNDLDQRNRQWFVQNYLPNIQKKLSLWTQMLPVLKSDSSYRLEHDKNYTLFLKTINPKESESSEDVKASARENWGVEDLQMGEAVNLLKDMIILQSEGAFKEAK